MLGQQADSGMFWEPGPLGACQEPGTMSTSWGCGNCLGLLKPEDTKTFFSEFGTELL